MRVGFTGFLAIYLVVNVSGQKLSHELDKEMTQKLLDQAATTGYKLRTSIDVEANVDVKSVVIPYEIARRVFGKHVAERHIVVQLSISNSSPTAAFILHSAYIDFSQVGQPQASGLAALLGSAAVSGPGRAGSATSQISSVEGRVARGQLLDAQQTTARNITMRVLTTLGSVASGYSFAFGELGIAKGIAAFNGNVVPGVGNAWPDLTVAQLNRISDFGYHTNKLVPRQAGEIVVCFFPIANFLTPGFQNIFRKAPAMLFTPLQLLKDKSVKKILQQNLVLDESQIKEANNVLPCFQLLRALLQTEPGEKPQAERTELKLLQTSLLSRCQSTITNNPDGITQLLFLQSLSFDNILIKVDGAMAVDPMGIPARIGDLKFEGDDKAAAFWVEAGVKKGEISGNYLANGSLEILEHDKLGIEEIRVDSEKSTDEVLKFSFKLTKPLPSGTKLRFVVKRKHKPDSKTESTVVSQVYEYVVGFVMISPVVEKVSQEGATVTMDGANMLDNPPDNGLKLSLQGNRNAAGKTIRITPKTRTEKKLTFDVPSDAEAGCWAIGLSVGVMAAPEITKKVAKLPDSKLSGTPKREGTTMTVSGTGLIDTADCGTALQFKARSSNGEVVVIQPKTLEQNKVVFEVPEELRKVKWTLELWQGATEKKPSLAVEPPAA